MSLPAASACAAIPADSTNVAPLVSSEIFGAIEEASLNDTSSDFLSPAFACGGSACTRGE